MTSDVNFASAATVNITIILQVFYRYCCRSLSFKLFHLGNLFLSRLPRWLCQICYISIDKLKYSKLIPNTILRKHGWYDIPLFVIKFRCKIVFSMEIYLTSGRCRAQCTCAPVSVIPEVGETNSYDVHNHVIMQNVMHVDNLWTWINRTLREWFASCAVMMSIF